ncbi:5-formyltetrahydrofolate cyclo-ligase [Parvularcula marina]|uniref:5-formyltetrahydrofolate cyclo-ligase n=1 Tax=Parvularcula marina TaxID=2292771 RepID=UPI003518CCB1
MQNGATPPPLPDLDWKAAFRKRAKAARAEAAAADGGSAAMKAAHHFIEDFIPQTPLRIALYCPVGDELDTAYLNADLLAAGHEVLLPVAVEENAPLIFRQFRMDTPLIKGRYGIPIPPESAPEATPEIIAVPVLGVRRDGARLGMGGGYYDRTLMKLRAEGEILAIGFGYAAQKMERFPVMPHDEFLDGYVSEDGAERFERRR